MGYRLTTGAKYIMISTLFFAVMNVGVKYLKHIPAHEIVFFRGLVSLLICWILIRRAGLNPWGNNKKVLLLRGISGTAALLMYFYTLQKMPLASAVTIQYLSPIFTIIVAGFMLKEPPTSRQWGFFLISFTGLVMMKGFDSRISLSVMSVGVVSAVFSALAYNFIRLLKDYDHPLVVVLYFPLVTVPVVGPFTYLTWVSPGPLDWLILIIIGIAVTVAQIYMTRAYQADKAANISNYNYLGSVYAIVLGWALFGEMMGTLSLVGIALIIAGVVLGSRYGRN